VLRAAAERLSTKCNRPLRAVLTLAAVTAISTEAAHGPAQPPRTCKIGMHILESPSVEARGPSWRMTSRALQQTLSHSHLALISQQHTSEPSSKTIQLDSCKQDNCLTVGFTRVSEHPRGSAARRALYSGHATPDKRRLSLHVGPSCCPVKLPTVEAMRFTARRELSLCVPNCLLICKHPLAGALVTPGAPAVRRYFASRSPATEMWIARAQSAASHAAVFAIRHFAEKRAAEWWRSAVSRSL
jgi:hypothetical protein